MSLTPSGWVGFTFKTCVDHLKAITLQLHHSPADCARELFKCSNM